MTFKIFKNKISSLSLDNNNNNNSRSWLKGSDAKITFSISTLARKEYKHCVKR